MRIRCLAALILLLSAWTARPGPDSMEFRAGHGGLRITTVSVDIVQHSGFAIPGRQWIVRCVQVLVQDTQVISTKGIAYR